MPYLLVLILIYTFVLASCAGDKDPNCRDFKQFVLYAESGTLSVPTALMEEIERGSVNGMLEESYALGWVANSGANARPTFCRTSSVFEDSVQIYLPPENDAQIGFILTVYIEDSRTKVVELNEIRRPPKIR